MFTVKVIANAVGFLLLLALLFAVLHGIADIIEAGRAAFWK